MCPWKQKNAWLAQNPNLLIDRAVSVSLISAVICVGSSRAFAVPRAMLDRFQTGRKLDWKQVWWVRNRVLGSSPRAHHLFPRSFAGAQDFGCGLPLRSRPQHASSSNLSGRTMLFYARARTPAPPQRAPARSNLSEKGLRRSRCHPRSRCPDPQQP